MVVLVVSSLELKLSEKPPFLHRPVVTLAKKYELPAGPARFRARHGILRAVYCVLRIIGI